MADIRIKKRVTLEFLGESYKDSFLVFHAMPIKDYRAFQEKIDKIGDNNQKATEVVLSTLKENFVEGSIDVDGKDQPVEAADLDSLDIETILKAFQRYTGTDIAPKV